MHVAKVTIFSIIVSFTLTPMLASIILPEQDTKKHKIGDFLERMFKSWEKSYQKLLSVVIKNRLTSVITVLIAVIFVVFGYGQLACACIAPASTSELSVQAPETIMEMSDPAHMAHSSNPAHDISQKTEKMDT